jgi:hypothetical protein|nr:MAG TPA: hypothetical protein [Caudoviricetes sp.]
MQSKKVLDVISIAKTFNALPSDVIGLSKDDPYTRYCFDEACTYLYSMMQPDKDGHTKEPIFEEDRKKKETKYNNPGLELLLGKE